MKPLLVNGKPFDPLANRPAVKRIMALLASLPDNQVFGSTELAHRWNMNERTFLGLIRTVPKSFLAQYLYNDGPRRIWGTAKALAEYGRLLSLSRGEE